MRLSKLAFVLVAAVIGPAIVVTAASATGNDPCKVLTPAKFSQIMGYAAPADTTGSTQTSCFYQGPDESGGQFMILTEAASGPQADAMLNRRGSSPPPGSGRGRFCHRALQSRLEGAALAHWRGFRSPAWTERCSNACRLRPRRGARRRDFDPDHAREG